MTVFLRLFGMLPFLHWRVYSLLRARGDAFRKAIHYRSPGGDWLMDEDTPD